MHAAGGLPPASPGAGPHEGPLAPAHGLAQVLHCAALCCVALCEAMLCCWSAAKRRPQAVYWGGLAGAGLDTAAKAALEQPAQMPSPTPHPFLPASHTLFALSHATGRLGIAYGAQGLFAPAEAELRSVRPELLDLVDALGDRENPAMFEVRCTWGASKHLWGICEAICLHALGESQIPAMLDVRSSYGSIKASVRCICETILQASDAACPSLLVC